MLISQARKAQEKTLKIGLLMNGNAEIFTQMLIAGHRK